MLFMACNALQPTTVENPTRTASLLSEIHQLQFFQKNSHIDTGPTLNLKKFTKIKSILTVHAIIMTIYLSCSHTFKLDE